MSRKVEETSSYNKELEALKSLKNRTIAGLNKWKEDTARFVLIEATKNEYSLIKQALSTKQSGDNYECNCVSPRPTAEVIEKMIKSKFANLIANKLIYINGKKIGEGYTTVDELKLLCEDIIKFFKANKQAQPFSNESKLQEESE